MFGQRKKRFISGSVSFSDRISKLVEGLIYISETDSEIFPFTGTKADGVTKENLLAQIGSPADTPVEERIFSEVFDRLTSIKDWYGDEEKKTTAKYLALRKFLEANLKDLKVFKVGRITIEIYFVGLDKSGNLKGIKTNAVET